MLKVANYRAKKIISSTFLLVIVLTFTSSACVSALTPGQRRSYANRGIYFIDEPCNASDALGSTAGMNNNDYAGRKILTNGQLKKIAANQSTYEQAADKVDIPWQLLAVIHLREHGLAVSNPNNGQGIYQFVNHEGGPYPTGPVSGAEFLRQTIFLANKLKDDYAKRSPVTAHKTLTAASDAGAIKDLFFSYNGRADVYKDQATRLGFSGATEGYEGSPYVVNKIDAKRDPTALGANEKTWGQIKSDHGAIEYPANNDYGAYVTYKALGGISGGGIGCGAGAVNCSTPDSSTSGLSPVRQKVVCVAKAELNLWKAGTLKPGTDYYKYSQKSAEEWCADFTSWVYKQAGRPIGESDEKWRVNSVVGQMGVGQQNEIFTYHSVTGNVAQASYKPTPGDLVIHLQGNTSHVNIVIGVTDKKMTLIGGNQGPGGTPEDRAVTQYTVEGFRGVDDISGYVSPKQ